MNTKTKILAQFYAVLFALLPSIVWAQQTPQPIIQGGTSWLVFSTGQTATPVYSDLIDTSGMTSLTITVQAPSVACGADVAVFGGGIRPSSGVTGMAILDIVNGVRTVGMTNTNFVYEVGPLPPFVKLRGAGLNAAGCTGTSIYAVLNPIASQIAAVGAVSTNTQIASTFPVIVGGTRRNNGTDTVGYIMPARMAINGGMAVAGYDAVGNAAVDLSVDTLGVLYTKNSGGTLTEPNEILVGVAATSMGSAKSFTIFNNGINSIYCGFANTVTTATGWKVGPGQGAAFDFAVATTMWCITTVAQVVGSGTRIVTSDTADTTRIYGGGSTGGGSGVGVAGDIHAPVAYQVSKAATTTVASPVGVGVIWKVRIQNLGNDELMIANVDPPTEAVSHRVQAGGDVWEVEWKDALYMKLKSDAATSPQVTPEDVRVTVMHY